MLLPICSTDNALYLSLLIYDHLVQVARLKYLGSIAPKVQLVTSGFENNIVMLI